jgi:mRNA interferase MazF
MTPERGQVVWVNFNPQKGHEQSGRRPALVISPTAYNGVSNCVLLCPITSNTDPWPWKVVLPENGEVTGAVLVDQIKSIDATARKLEGTEQHLTPELMEEVLARLATLTA